MKNHLKIAFRHLFKQKWLSALHLGGLSIGMMSTLFLLLFVRFEFSFEQSFQDTDQIFKLIEEHKTPEETNKSALTPYTFGRVIAEQSPEVEVMAAASGPYTDMQVSIPREGHEDVHLLEDGILLADSNFLKIFKLQILSGDQAKALSQPNNVVLTHSTAKRLFGEEDPIGKPILVSRKPSVVTAVCEDVPDNSHLSFNYLVSASSVAWFNQREFNLRKAHCYLKLRDQSKQYDLEAKFPEFVNTYLAGAIAKIYGKPWEAYLADGNQLSYSLQALPEIYLHPDDMGWMKAGGNRQLLWLLMGIGMVILFLALANFVNMNLAQAHERFKELGIRKVLGASKSQILIQLMHEAIVLVILSTIVAALVVLLSYPYFEKLLGKAFMPKQWEIGLLLLPFSISLFSIGVALLPGWSISSFSPLNLLKKSLHPSMKNHWIKWTLSGFQSWLSLGLILATLIIYGQFKYLSDKDLGYEQDQVVVIEGTFNRDPSMTQPFLERLQNMAGIKSASGTLWVPSYGGTWRDHYQVQGQTSTYEMYRVMIGDQFCELMDIELLEGELFSEQSLDSNFVLINESAKTQLGLENPIGQRLLLKDKGSEDFQQSFQIKGMVKDFHFHSLKYEVAPLVIQSNEVNHARMRYILAKIDGKALKKSIDKMKASWLELVPGRPFVYSFLDENLQEKYKAEKRLSRLTLLFSIIAIFIACLGFLAIFSQHLKKQAKEISIRRVIGANGYQIFYRLSSRFLWIFTISIVLTIPLIWLIMNNWLDNYPYRITPNVWTFLAGVGLLGSLLLMIIIAGVLKAISNSPSKYLHD